MNEMQQLEQEIKATQEIISRRNLALKLSENHEFRKLILDEYFVKEASRLIHIAGDPSLDEKQRADALQMALATGHLKRYLSAIVGMGQAAENSLPDKYAMMDELRSEEGNS